MTVGTAADTSSVLFLSVDMVRSKQLKTAYIRKRQSWLPLFRDLFETFPLILVGKVALRFDDHARVPEYRIWKTLGDEIIFSTAETDPAARALLLASFHDAVVQFDARNKGMGGYGVKGCAWNVTLDGMNETIEIPEMSSSPDGGAYEDLIGPDVDFGFVLAKHSREGEVVVDADLARLLDTHGTTVGLQAVAHGSVDTPFRLESQASTFLLAAGVG